jgi:hypothetical protein
MNEEQFIKLRSAIERGIKENPGAMYDAFLVTVLQLAFNNYDEFIVGLENELTREDKVNIFCGFLEKAAEFWDTAEPEDGCKMAIKILDEFEVQKKTDKRITNKKFKIKVNRAR